MNRQRRLGIFAAALALSLVAHALLISGRWIGIPDTTESDPPPLLARLEPAPAPQVVPPPPPPPARAVKPVVRAAAPRPAVPLVVAAPSPGAFSFPVEALPEPQAAAPEEVAEAAPEPAAPEPIVIADAAPSTLAIEPAALKTLPRRGHIAYALLLGTDRFNVGRTIQTWETSGDSYRMESHSETTGLVAAFRSEQRLFRSNGRMTPHGLQPAVAEARRSLRGRTEESSARFDWTQRSITISSAAGQRSGALPAGSQDILSFMYQLSLAPPQPGRLQIAIANGARFENHEFEVAAPETLETPVGNLRALPVRQIRKPGAESIEIWLAAEYRYLPVRIRFIGRNGEPTGEQLVTEIRISEE